MLLQNAAVVAVEAVLIGAVIVVGLAIGDPIVEPEARRTPTCSAPSSASCCSASSSVGWPSWSGRPPAPGRSGSAPPAPFAALAYLGSTLPELVEGLRPVRWFSPFFYATSGSPLALGFTWWHAGVLAALAVVVLAVGVVLFDRRALAR